MRTIKQNIKFLTLFGAALIFLNGCNSGSSNTVTPSVLNQNDFQAKVKTGPSMEINFTLDGEALSNNTDNWQDMGWHLLTMTVSSAPPNQSPLPVGTITGTIGSPIDPPAYGETVSVRDINCNGATFNKAGQACSAYIKVNYDYAANPGVYPIVTVNLSATVGSLTPWVQPKDYLSYSANTAVGIYRPIHTFESQYYSGSTVKTNSSQYRMLLMQNGNVESISISNLTPPTNPTFTLLHRTISGNADPIYGQWSECSLTANTNLNQVSTLPNLNSSCILVYKAAATSTSTTQAANLTVGTSANTIFPYNATSYTLQANYGNGNLVFNCQDVTFPNTMNAGQEAYGNGKFVIIGNNNQYGAYSTDGINWNQVRLPQPSQHTWWHNISFGDGKFVAIDENAQEQTAAYSTDGINWNTTSLPNNNNGSWVSLAYGNGTFVVTSGGSAAAAYSTDGVSWNPITLPLPPATPYARYSAIATYGNGKFVAVSNSSTGLVSSDGINWQTTTLPENAAWETVVYGAGRFFTFAQNYPTDYYNANSLDGVNWNNTTTNGWFNASYNTTSAAYGEGVLATVDNGLLTSTDGINWSSQPINSEYEVDGGAYGNNTFSWFSAMSNLGVTCSTNYNYSLSSFIIN